MENMNDVFVAIDNIKHSLQTARKDGKVYDIKVETFKDLMSCFTKLNTSQKDEILKHEKELHELNDVILHLLTTTDLQFESQIVCSKAVCALNLLVYDTFMAIKNYLKILKVNDSIDNSVLNEVDANLQRNNDIFNICLCLALLESNIKIWKSNGINVNNLLINKIFPICEKASFRYSSATLSTFRCLVKIFELLRIFNESKDVLNRELIVRIMDIVMANWENPLKGIRDQNSFLFRNLLLLTNKLHWFDCVINKDRFSVDELFNVNPISYIVFNQQTWLMKSKFFLLVAIFKERNAIELLELYKSDLLQGLKVSLQYPYLAPCGADLYRACIESITFEKWKEIFLPLISEVFNSNGHSLAKQNLISYWIQSTLKIFSKSFNPIYEIVKHVQMNNLYVFISIFKIGRKEGLINWGEHNEVFTDISEMERNKIHSSLIDSDELTRANAFSSVCVTKYPSLTLPTREEINLIRKFLIENISYDCARLRQSIVLSFEMLFLRICESYLHKSNKNKNDDLKYIIDFILWLNKFLIDNLEDGCNFQRKFTSLLLYDVILNHIILDKSSPQRKKIKGINVFDFTKIKESLENMSGHEFLPKENRNILFKCISDPSENVRDEAKNILSKYFQFKLNDINEIKYLYNKGKNLCSDRLFYNAESGALLIKTVTILIYKYNPKFDDNEILKKLFDKTQFVSQELLHIAENQKNELLNDILKAAANGSPLHGILSAIISLFMDPKSPEFGCFNSDNIERLLNILENVTEKLINALSLSSAKITDFAPSFADMGESIDAIAHHSKVFSKFGSGDEGDETQLSSVHLLILNCIWLNIKTCCIFASKLVTTSLLEPNAENLKRCVNVITHVLKRCRHKGAIETAGVSIMQVTKYLTAHKNKQFQQIPERILNELFHNFILSKEGTVSRRSAGLSILVHRIIVGDSSHKKPLLHSCIMKLVEIANRKVETYDELTDLPQSRALHFLCGLVQDSTLRQEMVHHIHVIATLCFRKLSSHIWTLRNAALLLFGALLPKLIGVKKIQESEDSSEYYTIAFEELYFHTNTLFDIIDKQFQPIVNTLDINEHSKLIPALTLLSNLTITMHSNINHDLDNIIKKFSNYLEKLYDSPIYHIRKSSARINCNFCLPNNLGELIKIRVIQLNSEFNKTTKNYNRIHSLLLSLKYLLMKFDKLKESMIHLNKFQNDINNSLRLISHDQISNDLPYFIKMLLSDITDHCNKISDSNKNFIEIFNKNKLSKKIPVGFYQWCSKEISDLILNCNVNELKHYTDIFLIDNKISDVNIAFISNFKTCVINNEKNINNFTNDDYNYFLNIFINFVINRNEIEIISLMLELISSIVVKFTSKFHINIDKSNDKIHKLYDKFLSSNLKYGVLNRGLILPVICRLIDDKVSFEFIKNNIVNLIYKWSSPDEHNKDLRMYSINSLINLIPYLNSYKRNDEIGVIVWKSICNFLQDENVDLRLEITKFTIKFFDFKFCNNVDYVNPYVSLNMMYNINVMRKLMSEKCAIDCLWCALDVNYDKESSNLHPMDNLNPFDHGVSNIYQEDVKIVDFIHNELLNVVNDHNREVVLNELIVNNNKCKHSDNIVKCEDCNSINDYLVKKKLWCKNKILLRFNVSN